MGEQDDGQMIALWVGKSAVGQSQAEAPRQSLSSLPTGPWHISWIRWHVAGGHQCCSTKCSLYGVQMRWLDHFLDLLCGKCSHDSLIFIRPYASLASVHNNGLINCPRLGCVGGAGETAMFMNPSRCTDVLHSPKGRGKPAWKWCLSRWDTA